MNLRLPLACLVLILFSTATVNSQVTGYINVMEMVERMPEIKNVEAQLQKYQTQLIRRAVSEEKAWKEYKDARDITVREQMLTRKKRESRLESWKKEIMYFESSIPSKIEAKRLELLVPIRKKVIEAVRKVAQRKKINSVFDTSFENEVVYGDPRLYLASDVAKELGLPWVKGQSFSAGSQTFAYFDSTSVITGMSAYKNAESEITRLRNKLENSAKEMKARYDADYEAFVRQNDKGELSQTESQNKEKEFEKRLREILQNQQDALTQFENKKSELQKPIYDRVSSTIASMARSNGIQLVFNKSVLFYSIPTADLTNKLSVSLEGGTTKSSGKLPSGELIGFVDLPALRSNMPEVKRAESYLRELQINTIGRRDAMVFSLEAAITEYRDKVKRGRLSPSQQQTRSNTLKVWELEISKFEEDSAKLYEKKRLELVQSINKRITKAITEAAREKGVHFVFDSHSLAYGDAQLDLGTLVLKKLGIQPPSQQ